MTTDIMNPRHLQVSVWSTNEISPSSEDLLKRTHENKSVSNVTHTVDNNQNYSNPHHDKR